MSSEDKPTSTSTTTTTESKDDSKDESKDATTTATSKNEKEPSFRIPSRMKAIVQTGYNEKDVKSVIKVEEIDTPKPGANEVLIKVYAASLNPVDYKIAMGWMSTLLKLKFPYVIGRDCAGVIVSLGRGVSSSSPNLKRGMKVAGQVPNINAKMGTWAEYVILPANSIAVVPDDISWNDAASIPLAGQTSYQALVDRGKLKANDKVLILGGASGCGILAIQIAKAFGASEIAVTSSQEEFCKEYGATKVFNYKKYDSDPVGNVSHCWYKSLNNGNYDIIYDCVGGKEAWEYGQKVLKKNGHFVTIVGDSKHGQATTIARLVTDGAKIGNRKFWSLFGSNQSYDHFLMDTRRGLSELFELISENKLKAVLDNESPFNMETVYNMLDKSMQHKAHGKLVIEFNKTNDDNNSKSDKSDIETDKNDNTESKDETDETDNNNTNPNGIIEEEADVNDKTIEDNTIASKDEDVTQTETVTETVVDNNDQDKGNVDGSNNDIVKNENENGSGNDSIGDDYQMVNDGNNDKNASNESNNPE